MQNLNGLGTIQVLKIYHINKEIWKDIPGYEGSYQVSNIGRVRSFDREFIDSIGRRRLLKGRVFFSHKSRTGYIGIRLHSAIRQKKRKSFLTHRLVLMAFKGMPTKKRPHCNHINGIKTDNRIENLEWCSNKENVRHAYRIGLCKRGEGNHLSKLKEKDVLMAIELLKRDVSTKEISKRLNISICNISSINIGATWKHLSNDFPISKRTNRGETIGTSKLKEKDVVEIKKLLRNKKLKHREIAKMFSVSGTTISEIRSKKNWSHVR